MRSLAGPRLDAGFGTGLKIGCFEGQKGNSGSINWVTSAAKFSGDSTAFNLGTLAAWRRRSRCGRDRCADAAQLKINGRSVIEDPAPTVTRFNQSGSISLVHSRNLIEVDHRKVWGGASIRLMWQLASATQTFTIPTVVLTPQVVSDRRQ